MPKAKRELQYWRVVFVRESTAPPNESRVHFAPCLVPLHSVSRNSA